MEENNILYVMRQCFAKILPTEDSMAKVSPLDFVASLVFCFLGDTKSSSLEAKRRWMNYQIGISLSRSSFWERLTTDRLKTFLELLVAELMTKTISTFIFGEDILEALGVAKIFLLDSSSISLWNSACKKFPGTRTTAGIKWHCCFDLLAGKMSWFQTTPTSTHDRKCFPPMKMLKGALIIFDLGYWDYGLFLAIEEASAFFLSRIKTNSAIKIFGILKGISKKHVGKKLSLLSFNRRGDLVVELVGKILIDKKEHLYRVVGFWNPNEKNYHWYITNLKIPGIVIYPLYRIRWAIELIFKSCKQSLNVNEIPSGNSHIIENLLLASLVSHICSSSIFNISASEIDENKKLAISFQRVTKIVVVLASDFIQFLRKKSVKTYKILIENLRILLKETYDPNYRHRPTSLQRLSEVLKSCKSKNKEGEVLLFKGKNKKSFSYGFKEAA